MLRMALIWSLVFLIFPQYAVSAEEPGDKIPVVLSSDVGNEIDDQWTVAYLLTHPAFDVKGVMSAHAPVLRPPAGQVSYGILREVVEKCLGMVQHPPLLAGADIPIAEMEKPYSSEAADFLIEVSKPYNTANRLKVLMIGAGTDIALALMKDPGLSERIEIIQMGFKSWEEGGDDYNTKNDVDAIRTILASDVPLVSGSIEVCIQDLKMGYSQARDYLEPLGKIGAWLWGEYETFYYARIKPRREKDFSKFWVIWDNVAVAYLLGMTTHETRPRPQLAEDLKFKFNEGQSGTITWITSVDSERLWADFADRVIEHQRTHQINILK